MNTKTKVKKARKSRRMTCKSCFGSGRIEDENDAPGDRRCDDCVGKGYYHATPKTPKAQAVKARRMYADEWNLSVLNRLPVNHNANGVLPLMLQPGKDMAVPVFVINADPASVEAMTEQVASVMAALPSHLAAKQFDSVATAVLRSLGLLTSKADKK